MSARPRVAFAVVVLLGGVGSLLMAGLSGSDAAQSVVPDEPHLAAAYPRAAAAAYGRRVLVLRAPPLQSVRAEILESARIAGGWEMHPVAPAGAVEFATALAEVAVDAASEWDDDRLLSPATVDALARAAVAVVVVEDGQRVSVPERAAEVPGLAPEASVPALRVRGAEPVLRVTGSEEGPAGPRAALEPARVRDFEDDLWGGSAVVEVEEPGTYVFAWPREGARVTVDGADAVLVEPVTDVPFVTLELPAGDRRVEVRFRSARGPATWAIAGALAVVVSLVILLLAFRPHPERDEDEAKPAETV